MTILVGDPFYIFLGIVGSLSFGLTAVILRLGVQNQNIFYGINLRILASVPFLVILNLYINGFNFFEPYLNLENSILVFVIALFLLLGDLLLMKVLKKKPVGLIAPLIAVSPLFTILLLLITGEADVTLKIVILTLIIVIGISLVTYNPDSDSKNVDLEAIVYGLSIGCLWGLMLFFEVILLNKPNLDGISFSAVKFLILGLIGLIFYLVDRSREDPIHEINSIEKADSRKFLLLAGFIGWVLGSILVYTALNKGPVEIITPIIGLNPLFAVIISISLGHEVLNKLKTVGILMCVISSVFLVS